MYYVYKHTVPNGKVYIGITKNDPETRWMNGWGYENNRDFFHDIVLYGWLGIKHEILAENLTDEEARDMEAELIAFYESYKKDCGYNQVVGKKYGYVETQKRYEMNREEYLEYCKTSEEFRKKCVPESKCKKVYQYTLDNVFVAEYYSIAEAARATGINKYCIRDCVRGKAKQSHGYRWVLANA